MTVYRKDAVFFESVSNVTATNSVEVGTRRTEGDEDYIYVYNTGASQISVGRGAVLSAVTGYSVTVSSVTQVDALVGVCKHNTIAASYYGWLVTRGFTDIKNGMADTGVAAGDIIFLGPDGGFIKPPSSAATDVAIQQGGAVGKIMLATGSAGTAHAYIRAYY